MIESMDRSAEDELAVQIISNLVNFRKMMVDRLLIPAGVAPAVCRDLLARRGQDRGKLSKREMGVLLMAQLRDDPDRDEILHALFELAAIWQNFDLAQDRYVAQATSIRAKEVVGAIAEAKQHQSIVAEQALREAAASAAKQQASALAAECSMLRAALDDLAMSNDHQNRGFVLQGLLERLFRAHDVPVMKSFTRNDGGEQIDGAFQLDGWNYLVECRWRARLADIRQLDGLKGQLGRSGRQTMGLFLSIEGWSENVVPLLKQNPDKNIILMDGYDLRTSPDQVLDLRHFLRAKAAKLSLEAEPFLSVREYQLAMVRST